MKEEYFESTYLYCAHPWKLEKDEEEEEAEEDEAERMQMIYSISKYEKHQTNKNIWKGSNTMGEGVSFASKWKIRNRKGIVWVFNTITDINEINEKVWITVKKDTFPTQTESF